MQIKDNLPPTETLEKKSNREKYPNLENADNLSMKKLKIVIADDDPTSNYLLSIFLGEKSHRIIQVINGKEAVDVCRQDDEIDLVLMDIRMPIMDGYTATKAIRSFNSEIIIIAQTAFGFSNDREKAVAAGCNDYLGKPINKTRLFELIKMYFDD